jgi:Fe-S oxidoreductase
MSEKKQFSRDVRLRLEMCSSCMKMCRDNCPTTIASSSESLTPYMRTLTVNLNEKKIRAYDEGALDSIFSCLTCNLCNTFCLPKVDEEDLMKLARASIIESGIDISKYSKISESIAANHNPLQEAHQNRIDSVKDLITASEESEILLFLGCMGSYREIEIARASIELLRKLKIKFTVMHDEWCCGSPAIQTGFLKQAEETMNHNVTEWKERGITQIITPCSACYRIIKTTYPRYISDFNFHVQHVIEVIKSKIDNIQLAKLASKVTYHDPCHLGRAMKVYEAPRELLQKIPAIEFVEMEHSHEESFCCGSGGGVRANFPDLSRAVGVLRIEEIHKINAEYLISACPLCKYHFKDLSNKGNLKILDIVELINQLLLT